jgi:hypothetical protein
MQQHLMQPNADAAEANAAAPAAEVANRISADLTKEDVANKSTAVDLGNTSP